VSGLIRLAKAQTQKKPPCPTKREAVLIVNKDCEAALTKGAYTAVGYVSMTLFMSAIKK
jgi:hypothetical protein